MGILLLWTLFHQFRWLLAIMIVLAALVLFNLAEEGLEHIQQSFLTRHAGLARFIGYFGRGLAGFNRLTAPVLRHIIPNVNVREKSAMSFWPLLSFSLLIPFILGLDDFAGYVPLFNIVNVFGFAIGVFLAHMILNSLLFISPERTIKVVKNSVISLLGSLVFVGLGLWGLVEVVRIFTG
jgi:hypothetical protein